MPCSSTINIVAFTPYPCCSWKLSKQHDCDNAISRHYKDGLLEAKMYSPARIYRDGSSFTIMDGKTSFYIDYTNDVIQVEGVEIDRDVVTVDAFEAYLQGLFCCTENILPAYSLYGEESSYACRDDVSTLYFLIKNMSGIDIPAGTIFLLEWSGLGDNPVFASNILESEIAITGETLELVVDFEAEDTILFGVSFDNAACAPVTPSVSISANDNYTLSTDPLVLTSNGGV